ncbi:hypothetical protein ACVW0Y_004222 [Pseudomonas sp. TE3786]
MQPLTDLYISAFPGHDVSLQPRPDGTFVLALKGADKQALIKVIAGKTVYSQAAANDEILNLKREVLIRDNALSGSSVHCTAHKLPTYSGQELSLRAMQSLFNRRKIAL